MNDLTRFYVYVDRRNDNNEPFYVGRGRVNRINDYKCHNKIWHSIVSSHGLRRDIVFETEVEQESIDKEIQLIFSLKTRDYLGGANMSDGTVTSVQKNTRSPKEIASALARNRMNTVDERQRASDKFQKMWDENRDEVMKTHIRGETHPKSRLKEQDVLDIRAAYATLDTSVRGTISNFYREWSTKLDVTSENLFRVVHRKSWKHI